MTLRQAMLTITSNGDMAAKRPSMAGYVRRAEKSEDVAKPTKLAWRRRDGSEFAISVDADRRTFAVDDEVALGSEMLTAILAEDWEVAPAADLEAARMGAGAL